MFNFLQPKLRCPSCKQTLASAPTRKQNCPHCGKPIFVRAGELVTEDEANIRDWLLRLEWFEIKRKDFDDYQSKLSKKFGKQASVNETVWSILNYLVVKYAKKLNMLERVYQEMASLASKEGKGPTQYLIEAEKLNNHNWPNEKSEKQVFLGHDELAYVRSLRKDGKLEKAEELLYKAEPSPAVLDEIRKIASDRAKYAKKNGDWQAVVTHLEGYLSYASKWRDYCVKMVNQEPPVHTATDDKLLREAKQKLGTK